MLTDTAVLMLVDEADKIALEAACSVPEAFDQLVV
jgi:hypothetical protein